MMTFILLFSGLFLISILGTEAGSVTDVCKLKADTGPCTGAIPRYFYNHKRGECEEFSYGGCEGNENNFKTKKECEKHCSKPDGDICKLKRETGPCRASIERFYFNPETGECEIFIYGGCKGNENNFETKTECEQRCSPKNGDICKLKPEVGPCKAAFKRFYFNPKTGKCETFIYGGCQGNANNFKTKKECEERCPPQKGCQYCPERKDVVCVRCVDKCFSNDDCPDSCVCCKESCGNECRRISSYPTEGEFAYGPSCTKTCNNNPYPTDE